jgi:hypothetical protein
VLHRECMNRLWEAVQEQEGMIGSVRRDDVVIVACLRQATEVAPHLISKLDTLSLLYTHNPWLPSSRRRTTRCVGHHMLVRS